MLVSERDVRLDCKIHLHGEELEVVRLKFIKDGSRRAEAESSVIQGIKIGVALKSLVNKKKIKHNVCKKLA